MQKQYKHSLQSQLVRDVSRSTCRCPEIPHEGTNEGELITICFLKHSNCAVVEPTFWPVDEGLKDDIW
jgi:hypothetical protein